MNFPLPLLALLVAQRQGDSPNDAGRIALLAMTVRPPMVGLMLALAMSKQAALKPALPAPPKDKPNTSVIDSVVPRPDASHSFFPTFLGLTKKQAASRAREYGLNPCFIEIEHNTPGKDTVQGQDPLPGAKWPNDIKDVKLYVA
jgi:hypothetical protein